MSQCQPDKKKEEIDPAYYTKGYAVVDDFLPETEANRLYECFASAEYEQIDQVREHHYSHVFSTPNPYLPRPEEPYMARFGRSRVLEASETVNEIFKRCFKSRLEETAGCGLTHHDIRCYRMQPGDFYRAHIDDYAGAIGGIYYINKEWRWDWGGLLHVASTTETEALETIFPKFNRMVLINHKTFRFPHFISAVSSFAKVPRYTLVSFNT